MTKVKKDPVLVFNEEGTAVWIDFGNGSDTVAIEKRREALTSIHQAFLKNKINADQFLDFTKQVKEAPNLKDRKKDKGVHFGFGLMIGLEIMTKGSKPLENPRFEMCDCGNGKPHGIICGDSYRMDRQLYSTQEANAFLKKLRSDFEIISEDDIQRLAAQVKDSSLPTLAESEA